RLRARAWRRAANAIAGEGSRGAAPAVRACDRRRRAAPAQDRPARCAGVFIPADLHLLSAVRRWHAAAIPDARPRRRAGAVGVRSRRAPRRAGLPRVRHQRAGRSPADDARRDRRALPSRARRCARWAKQAAVVARDCREARDHYLLARAQDAPAVHSGRAVRRRLHRSRISTDARSGSAKRRARRVIRYRSHALAEEYNGEEASYGQRSGTAAGRARNANRHTVLPTLPTKADVAEARSSLVMWLSSIVAASTAIVIAVLLFAIRISLPEALEQRSAPVIIYPPGGLTAPQEPKRAR